MTNPVAIFMMIAFGLLAVLMASAEETPQPFTPDTSCHDREVNEYFNAANAMNETEVNLHLLKARAYNYLSQNAQSCR